MTTLPKQEDISLEASLLKALAVKKNYKQFASSLDKKKLIPTTAVLLDDYKKYYAAHSHDEIDWGLFYTEFSQNYHKEDLKTADLKYYREIVFPVIQNSEISDGLYVALLERQAVVRITKVLEKGYDSTQIEAINLELKTAKSKYTKESDELTFTIGELDLAVLDTSRGVEWFLKALQSGLLSLMPGQFVVVAADSNTGKSAFCISQAVHTFKKIAHKATRDAETARPILYCTSEDTEEDLACRFLSCLYRDKCLGGFEEVISDFSTVSESYKKYFDDSMFIGMQIRSASDLELIKQKIITHNPCLVIIDMLDKLSSSDNIQDLTKLYQEIRSIANSGYPIIGTSQTGNTSYMDSQTNEYKHRKKLTDKDMANSKSGKQGAASCLVMIGQDDDVPNRRLITTTKKKRGRNVWVAAELQNQYSFYKEW